MAEKCTDRFKLELEDGTTVECFAFRTVIDTSTMAGRSNTLSMLARLETQNGHRVNYDEETDEYEVLDPRGSLKAKRL